MVDKAKKTVQARARIAHKLAKYVRVNPCHYSSKISSQNPSISHLGTIVVIQLMVVLQRKSGITVKKLGIQLTIKRPFIKGKEIYPSPQLEENQLIMAML